MELVDDNDRASIDVAKEEEDRISNLGHDIIHHILSFLDMKDAIQTSVLSHKWNPIWTTMAQSMAHLNFNGQTFRTLREFERTVEQTLSRRDNDVQVSAVKLRFSGGGPNQAAVRRIITYAYAHNVKELSMTWFKHYVNNFPQYIFSSHALKHLTIAVGDHGIRDIPDYTWGFPALETLNLSCVYFQSGDATDKSLNPFSQCVNLKDLTLHQVAMDEAVETFHIRAPQLSRLTITKPYRLPNVYNVVAPRLENLTADIKGSNRELCPYTNSLKLSTGEVEFISLEKVNLSLPSGGHQKERYFLVISDLFKKLHTAKSFTLDVPIIQALLSCKDQLSREPCPFDNLERLKINTKRKMGKVILPNQVINYLLHNSPNAITNIAKKVPLKRPRQHVRDDETMELNKAAKIETEQLQNISHGPSST